MGNVLRDNKTIVNKAVSVYRRVADKRWSCVEISFIGTITFIYKDFNYSFRLQGLKFDVESVDIQLVEDNDKLIICLDTNNVYNFSRLIEDGLYFNGIPGFISINNVLNVIGKTVWNGMGKTHPESLKELCTILSNTYGGSCNDLDTFLKLFSRYHHSNMVSVVSGYIDSITYDNYWISIPKTVYIKDGLVGLCCFNFKNNIVTYPRSNRFSLLHLQVFTKSANQRDMHIMSINKALTKNPMIDSKFISLSVNFGGKRDKFISDDGMIVLEVS